MPSTSLPEPESYGSSANANDGQEVGTSVLPEYLNETAIFVRLSVTDEQSAFSLQEHPNYFRRWQ